MAPFRGRTWIFLIPLSLLLLSAAFLWPEIDTSSNTKTESSDVRSSPNSSLELSFPFTAIPGLAHIHGFTVLDNLYLRDGTFYIHSSNLSTLPPRRDILSLPLDIGSDFNHEPTDKELQYIDIDQVSGILGPSLTRIEGFTIIFYDPPQFMTHFYHWWGESILGAWRVYSSLATTRDGKTVSLPFPKRFLLPFTSERSWRDKAGVDGPLMRAAFPNTPMEGECYWQDLKALHTTVIFDRAMIINRESAHRHPLAAVWFKMIAGTMSVTVPDTFWNPIRESITRNLLGYIPLLGSRGLVIAPSHVSSSRPIVTYISRQGGGRRLIKKDHDGLVQALRALESEGLCELHVAVMEKMQLYQQIELIARSTIIVGVHGNGLTHQLFMPSSQWSTVIEILIPSGYTFDYEILARNVDHKHYAVWNDTVLTYPKGSHHQGVNFPDDFHGISIPVYGPAVANIIRECLSDPIH